MPVTPKRPGIVTFVAVVLIILGALALLGGICGIGGAVLIAALPEPEGKLRPDDILGNALAGPRMMNKEIPGYAILNIVGIVASLGFGVAQLMAGIGCWNLKPSGRKLAIIITIIYLIYALASQVFSAIYILPATEEIQKKQQANMPPGAPDLSAMTKIAGAAAMGCAVAFYITVTILVLVGLNTQSARAAFAPAPPAPPDGAFEEERPRKRYEGYDDDET